MVLPHMRLGVLRETEADERRVALVPDAVKRLVGAEHEVVIEAGAGEGASFGDALYTDAGATVADRAAAIGAEVVLCVRRPRDEDIARLSKGAILIGFLAPLDDPSVAQRLADAGATGLAIELIPRITRAQSMDGLSSQATIAGYMSALIAATRLPRFLPMLTTAAGTIAPARVLVIGAGVAGLQALATARRLGAVVSGYDTRAAAAEQVLSLGAKFLDLGVGGGEAEGGYARELTAEELAEQQKRLGDAIADFDAVITTAAVPGRPSPKIISKDVVERMRPGSVIVDLAAERGGNCEVTVPGQEIVHHGVTVVGLLNLASSLPVDASAMYGRNLTTLLEELANDDGELHVDLENDVLKGACIAHDGKVLERA